MPLLQADARLLPVISWTPSWLMVVGEETDAEADTDMGDASLSTADALDRQHDVGAVAAHTCGKRRGLSHMRGLLQQLSLCGKVGNNATPFEAFAFTLLHSSKAARGTVRLSDMSANEGSMCRLCTDTGPSSRSWDGLGGCWRCAISSDSGVAA